MRRSTLLICLAALLLPLPTLAEAQLLLDPAKAPMTLKGGWIQVKTGQRNDILVKIDAIQPDGTVIGKLDFYNNYSNAACKAHNAPIREGKVTDKMLRIVATGDNPAACPNITLMFRAGGEKFLQGKLGTGDQTWLDAPK